MAWELGSLAMLGWTSAELFELSPAQSALLGAVLLGIWALGAWRIATLGVYVSGRGVRVRGLCRSRTLAWHDIEGFRLHDKAYRLGGFTIPSGMTVLIERRDGRSLNSTLWAQGVDFHARPGVFRDVFHDLRLRHAAATAPAPA